MLTYLIIEGKNSYGGCNALPAKTYRKIIQRKGDYVFGLKEKQFSLLEDIRLFFEDQSNQNEWEHRQTSGKMRDRLRNEFFTRSRTFPILVLSRKVHDNNSKNSAEIHGSLNRRINLEIEKEGIYHPFKV